MANDRGGPDNITVLMARCDGDGLHAPADPDEVGHQPFPLIDTEASTDPVPVYRGSKPPVPAKQQPPNQARQVKPAKQDRGKRLAMLVGVVVVVAALGWQIGRSRSATEAPAPAVAAAPAQPDPDLLVLDRVADSVTLAVRGYGDRVAKFASHQVDCPVLAQGLADVEALWVSYNVGKRRAAPLDPTRQSRDQTLDASVDSVDRDFDRSGCPRP
jgi:hypothetical protein